MAAVDGHPGLTAPATERPPADEWRLRFLVTASNRRVVESLTTVADGRFGTRGLLRRSESNSDGVTVAAGAFTVEDVPDLLFAPIWTAVDIEVGPNTIEVAELDMLRGVLTTEIRSDGVPVRSMAFASIARPGVFVLEILDPGEAVDPGPPLVAPSGQPTATASRPAGDVIAITSGPVTITAVADQNIDDDAGVRTIRRVAAVAVGATDARQEVEMEVRDLLRRSCSDGPSQLLVEHESAWARRWDNAAVELPAAPELQKALRLAQFHLLSAASSGGEVAIGARATSGRAYRGHVFWDTDVFVVPALAAMAPRLARSALAYRWRRLGAARCRAAEEGFDGARFPWESAGSGFEAAPTQGRDLHGNVVPILTGQQEEHIVADVAWAVDSYLNWTGDDEFLREAGAEMLVDTARYWCSRIETDEDGTAHIRHVIGPDEYHEDVDDNAFTNVMAAWNLKRSAALAERDELAAKAEFDRWRDLADRLVDGYNEDQSIYEQHAGFFDLEPLPAASLGVPPVSADALLGRRRIQQIQIIKQADVLMLHHLLPGVLRAESLQADIDYYLPRTAHGSSLSPAITAAVLAAAGRTEAALEWFEMAARFDLDDIGGTTAGGLHLATMGGLWQAFTAGFMGIRALGDRLEIEPNLPEHWNTAVHRFHYRGASVRVEAGVDTIEVSSSAPIAIALTGQVYFRRALTARRSEDRWVVE